MQKKQNAGYSPLDTRSRSVDLLELQATALEKTANAVMIATLSGTVAANRHPGQVGYSHSPPQEVRDEESSLRADSSKEGEGQAAHAAACAAHQRQRQPDLPVFRSIAGALLHLERAV